MAPMTRHVRLFRYIEFDEIMAMATQLVRWPFGRPCGSNRRRAGGRSAGLPFDFTNAQSARAKGSQMLRDAEAGYRDPGLLCGRINGIVRLGVDGSTVDRDLHGHHGFRISLPENSCPEMFDRRQHRIGSTAAERTETGCFHRLSQICQQRQTVCLGAAALDELQEFAPTDRANPARCAFPTGFVRRKGHKVPGEVHHIGLSS